MHAYRTHTCGQLRAADKGKTVRISGWIHRVRDHGGVLFVDLRDHYGLTQVVVKQNNPIAKEIEKLKLENVISITGEVLMRTPETVNKQLPTGEIELDAKSMELLSSEVTDMLPLQVNTDEPYGEEVRLKYRFLDLRRNVIHRNIVLRSDVVYSMRRRMVEQGFREFTTPILTASSPEGARDFLVPSRLHPGKFYALPQAPQQFKQLLMMSGFDRYFQIAPCFRDEDARADRTAGEFYQLDMEMSFVTQEDVFTVMEKVIGGVFEEFSEFTGAKMAVSPAPWIRIPYDESMLKYGNDKPDLRCPIVMFDSSDMWAKSDFGVFKGIVEKGGQVRAIPAKNAGKMPRSWFDKLGSWAQSELGMPAPPGYIVLKEIKDGKKVFSGPLAKFVESQLEDLFKKAFPTPEVGDTVFFVGNADVAKLCAQVAPLRVRIGNELELSEKDVFKFCWVVDYPMFEINDKTNKVDFSHNPFSMPQGGLKALQTQDPLKIKATQYDCVANGLELCSGGIRNHNPDAMEKAFEIAGYPKGAVQEKFGGMYNAFKLGAPPHGGCAFGIDRIIMMLAKEPNIREVIAFPMNQQAEDLMMGAPSTAEPHQLRDVHIKLDLPKPQERKAG
jgi:aspartyl-tRNA synthetase